MSFYLKIALAVVGGSLCDLFHKSLFAGKFPEDGKMARIPSILKSGAKDDKSNYSPAESNKASSLNGFKNK